MPELPDVEGFRRYLRRHATGKRIEGVQVPDRAMLRNRTPSTFGRAVRGQRFGDPERHGKWLVVPLGNGTMLMHFGMTGLLHWADPEEERHRHDRVVFRCREGQLLYRNMRRFGGIWLARDEREYRDVVGRLGPDVMSLSRREFEERLQGRRGGLKAALMDQHLWAGIGNLLADEIMWRARLHPRRRTETLDARARERLHRCTRETITAANRYGRIPPREGWLTGARDRRDARCPRCDTPLRRATIAGRTTRWCPRCQREPRKR